MRHASRAGSKSAGRRFFVTGFRESLPDVTGAFSFVGCPRRHGLDRVAGSPPGGSRFSPRRRRSPGCTLLPPRAHRGRLRAGDRPGGRADRARRRRHPRRRPRRPARERAVPQSPTSPSAPSSPPAGPPRRSAAGRWTGWFAEDLTLAELRTLRAIERMPGAAPAQHRLRRPVRHPDPRRGGRAGPRPFAARSARSASSPSSSTPAGSPRRAAHGASWSPRSCAGWTRPDAGGTVHRAVVRRRGAARAAGRPRRGRPEDASSWSTSRPSATGWPRRPGCARSPPTPRASRRAGTGSCCATPHGR